MKETSSTGTWASMKWKSFANRYSSRDLSVLPQNPPEEISLQDRLPPLQSILYFSNNVVELFLTGEVLVTFKCILLIFSFRTTIQKHGISEEAAHIFRESSRPWTCMQYKPCIRKWKGIVSEGVLIQLTTGIYVKHIQPLEFSATSHCCF